MGNFLALSAVIGRTKNEVVDSLTNYAKSVDGGLRKEDNIDSDTENCCIVGEENGNTSIFYPGGYLEWDDSSEFVSKELGATVFSFHIHDGDLWMYVLYHNGQVIDQFNPIPDYWDDNLSTQEIESWQGNAHAIAKYIPQVKVADIDKYLIRWDLEEEESLKAYPTDEFAKEEWQLVDFMKKLKVPYPLDDNGSPKGLTYNLWTKQLVPKAQPTKLNKITVNKPWWKFW